MTDNTLHQLNLIRAAMVVSAATSSKIPASYVAKWAELMERILKAEQLEGVAR